MNKQVIIEKLEVFKQKLQSDVLDAYKQRGSSFGEQRVKSWNKSVLHFLDSYISHPSVDFDEIYEPIVFDFYSGTDAAADYWISEGKPLQVCIDSLIIDIQNDEYHFTPINKKPKQVNTYS